MTDNIQEQLAAAERVIDQVEQLAGAVERGEITAEAAAEVTRQSPEFDSLRIG
jgi:hypothetical protein